MSEHPYGDHVALVLESCPDASEDDIVKAFKQYEEEFFIPPQDAMHSIIRKLQVSSTPTSTGRSPSGGNTRTAKPSAAPNTPPTKEPTTCDGRLGRHSQSAIPRHTPLNEKDGEKN